MFARYYKEKNKDLHIHVTHGDITTRDGITKENILESNVNEVESYAVNSHLTKELFSAVIHIIDTDGAYVDNAHVVEDLTKDEVFYLPTEMRTKDKHGIEKRNLQKRENLNRMIGKKIYGLFPITSIMQIPLRRSRLSGTVRATNPDKREPLTFET